MADAESVPVTFRMLSARRDALDDLAHPADRDRSYLVNEAIAQHLEAQAGWVADPREGLRQAEAAKIASAAEVAEALAPRARRA